MYSIALRAVRLSSTLRYAVRPTPKMAVRAFTASSVTKQDLVQDLYIKQLKTFKPAAEAKGAEIGQVKELHVPSAPQPPKLEEDLTADLQAYQQEDPVAVSVANEEDQVEEEYADIFEEALKDEEEETEGH
ncbi:uncharacterized protein VTP21DRAFT_11121 [Calcarisporiella thermophila]|uniref:uncharacterized protein n=1 Tax=Calcarisporiella thermophila TaxID=911321 RepID=UPI0037422E9C